MSSRRELGQTGGTLSTSTGQSYTPPRGKSGFRCPLIRNPQASTVHDEILVTSDQRRAYQAQSSGQRVYQIIEWGSTALPKLRKSRDHCRMAERGDGTRVTVMAPLDLALGSPTTVHPT